HPGEVVPVAQLIHEVGPVLLARAAPEDAHVPVATGGDDVADGAVVEVLHRGDVAELVAALGAGNDGQVFLVRRFIGVQYGADAGAVHRDRLFGEDVLASRHGGREMNGAEAR